jgi:hypothetical protein
LTHLSRWSLVLLAVGLTGCSIAFVKPPRAELPDQGAAECTTSGIVPTIDVLIGLGAAIQSFRIAEGSGDNKDLVLAGWLGAAAIYTASAVAGYVAVSRCTDLQADLPTQPLPIRPQRKPRPPPP